MRILILVLSLSISPLAILGCGGDDDEGGGTAGSGGAAGSGGSAGSGGTAGSGGSAGSGGTAGTGGTMAMGYAACEEGSAFPDCTCDPYDTDSCTSPSQGCRFRYRFDGSDYLLPDLGGGDGYRATACVSAAVQPVQLGEACVTIAVPNAPADAFQDNCAPGGFCDQSVCIALCTDVSDCGSGEQCTQLNEGQTGPAFSVCM